jgi:glycine hydroxymethyltransferase
MVTDAAIGSARTLADRLADLATQHDSWRGRATLNLNAANNVLSPAARRMLPGRLADKGISGGLGRRHHMGGQLIDEMEQIVLDLGRQLFDAAYVEYRPASGSLANALAIASITGPDDALMVLGEAAAGHQSYRREGWGGRLARTVVDVPFDADRLDVDLAGYREALERSRPALVVIGTAMFILPYDLTRLNATTEEYGAKLLYDGAHPLGLIAGGAWQNPLDSGADLLTGSTQKSLFGPIGGLIVTRSDTLGPAIFDACTKLVSNYENNRVMALGVAFAEMAAFGHAYAAACVTNAQTLARGLAERGFEPLAADRGYTQSNQVILRVGTDVSADELVQRWEEANVVATAMALQHDATRTLPTNGIRLGVQELTRLGMGEDEMDRVAELLVQASDHQGARTETVRGAVTDLVRAFPTVYYCFDHPYPPGRGRDG